MIFPFFHQSGQPDRKMAEERKKQDLKKSTQNGIKMAWIENMTLKGKLLAGFIMVAIIAGAIGGFGIYNIKKIDEADTLLY